MGKCVVDFSSMFVDHICKQLFVPYCNDYIQERETTRIVEEMTVVNANMEKVDVVVEDRVRVVGEEVKHLVQILVGLLKIKNNSQVEGVAGKVAVEKAAEEEYQEEEAVVTIIKTRQTNYQPEVGEPEVRKPEATKEVAEEGAAEAPIHLLAIKHPLQALPPSATVATECLEKCFNSGNNYTKICSKITECRPSPPLPVKNASSGSSAGSVPSTEQTALTSQPCRCCKYMWPYQTQTLSTHPHRVWCKCSNESLSTCNRITSK
jgi:hypothetical protein